MSSTAKKIIVIGGGVAGLLCAITAAHEGGQVSLFEKMPKVGLKMGITGKGRCNITNAAPIMDFIAKTPGNGRFLYSAYEKFNNEDLLDLLHSWGLATKVERGGRVFPQSDDAQEVRHLFMKKLADEKVDLHLEEPVRKILTEGGRVKGILTGKRMYEADAVILTTGGASYPRTGSTGDGYRMARELGHKVTTIRPALIPLVCREEYCRELQGISLKNVTLSVDGGGRRKGEEFGEMLFTHFGISGPIVLSLSDKVSLWLSQGHSVKGSIDLKPALTREVLDKRVLRDLEKYQKRQMAGALQDLMLHRMIDVVLNLAGIPRDLPVSDLKKADRLKLVETLKAMPLTITGTRPIEEAIVTAGGISVKEVNPSTMESKLIQNLYFAGEVLDIHAFTGGYNLQAAFSTGHLAALSAVRSEHA
ncbi:NAD(P)/FAD-dependent oxidoreductase [Dialister sp.]|uniref:NAD(P)/FAD-dependent oxidoreductase n=1 Tax=Dialister sp. TaxID=1955814 RepID=UPI002E81B59E|nr:NAD(P)/FAD-dependent oxidoreductase [Dialister sp.]MEE3452666.1 NAD(P)/FAD-dependent oxidoreductase [Dialister sp.]